MWQLLKTQPRDDFGHSWKPQTFSFCSSFLALSQNLQDSWKWESRGCNKKQARGFITPLDSAGASGKTIPLRSGWDFFGFSQKHHPWSKVWEQALLSFKPCVKFPTPRFSDLQSSLNTSSSQTSSFPIPFYFIRISALRPGHPEAAGQGGGKVLVAPLGLSVIPIKLDFVEVGNSSYAVWQQYL